jgi:signal transduction histidine kinase
MISASRAVAHGGSLGTVLDQVAAITKQVLGSAQAIAITLTDHPRFTVPGSSGLSEDYRSKLNMPHYRPAPGRGASGLAFQQRRPLTIEDLLADTRMAHWHGMYEQEGIRSMMSVPLLMDGTVFAVLSAFRGTPGAWSTVERERLTFFGDHVASVVSTAQLLDKEHRETLALRRAVQSLTQQTHEHANRLHTVSGLLALGDAARAAAFVAELDQSSNAWIKGKLEHSVLVGLLMADSAIAARRGIRLDLEIADAFRRLPESLGDAQAVTILGNLLDNAFDAVAEQRGVRRRVLARFEQDRDECLIVVRDWGDGIDPTVVHPFARGISGKREHAGVGLGLVAETVAAVGGTVTATSHPDGTAFEVRIPDLLTWG